MNKISIASSERKLGYIHSRVVEKAYQNLKKYEQSPGAGASS